MHSGAAGGRECNLPVSGAASKRPSEVSGGEPPRGRRRASSPEGVSRTGGDGASPLHRAAEEGDLDRVRELIGRGADTRLRDRWGETPLHRALYGWKEAAAELLVAADSGVDVQNEFDCTPLHLAARNGYVETIRRLLAGGSRTRVRGECGMTPLHRALDCGREAAAELLVAADSGIDVQDEFDCTPLHHAAQNGYVNAIGKLLAAGSRTRIQDFRGKTPLHLALYLGREAAAELLAEADCCMEVRDRDGRTPLHLATMRGFQGALRIIVRSGTHPHVRDASGKYPIQLALRWRRRNENIPRLILSSYALKGIAIDRDELKLWDSDLQFCVEALSRCDAEIRLMRRTRVPCSAVTYFDIATRHATRVASRLPVRRASDSVLSDSARREFPVYGDLIASGLRAARERRVRTDRCRGCLSHLLPSLPTTCTGDVLLCLGDDDLQNVVRAVRLEA